MFQYVFLEASEMSMESSWSQESYQSLGFFSVEPAKDDRVSTSGLTLRARQESR